MNLPNKITLIRILLVPIFIIFLQLDFPYQNFIVTLVFILITLTDVLDGYLARKRKEVTEFGKVMDPIADKLLIAAALIFFIGKGVAPWIAFVIISREFLVTGLRIIASYQNIIIAASWLGKAKTITQIIAICSVMLNIDGILLQWFNFSFRNIFIISLSSLLMWIAALITIYSGWDYFLKAHQKKLF
jgi:CDP-diacylglycerol--glycerol-3-phosphate 3-phosphatidyltransferase